MSGHSKWANIKHKKGKADAARGKITTKIGREITIAVQMGGPDPVGNMRNGAKYEEITYEGYGPAGVAIMLDVLTDNRNRAAADIRHAFTKHGGNMGETGSVGWMFKRKGIFTIDKEAGYDEDEVMMIALDAGAEDMKSNEDSFEIVTQPEDYDAVEKALADNNIETVMSEITMVPDTMVTLSDEDAEKVRKTIDMFDDMDDVQEVYTNADLPDEDDEE